MFSGCFFFFFFFSFFLSFFLSFFVVVVVVVVVVFFLFWTNGILKFISLPKTIFCSLILNDQSLVVANFQHW